MHTHAALRRVRRWPDAVKPGIDSKLEVISHVDMRSLSHPADMKEIGVPNGSTVLVRSLWGEATFKCIEGKTPNGIIFVPYGPPTCRLMGQYTDGTGMPLSKGWEVEVILLQTPSSPEPTASEVVSAE